LAVGEEDQGLEQPEFYEDSVDFLTTTEDGQPITGRIFALYAADAAPAKDSLEAYVRDELGLQVVDPGVSAAYTFTGSVWPNGRPPAFSINPSGMPGIVTQKQGIEAILIGADLWGYENLQFTYAGLTKLFPNAGKPDGRFTVSFGGLPKDAIGMATTWCPGCAGGPIEYDIRFKVGWTGWTYDQLLSTAAHEFGHVAGLGHETAGCGDRQGAVMCPAAGSILPTADDLAGIRALYGGDGPPAVPQPTRYTGRLTAFKPGLPTVNDVVLAINPATGAICGATKLKLVDLKPWFSMEAYGDFRSKPGCPEDGGQVRFYFPKTRHWSAINAPWTPGGDFVNPGVEIVKLEFAHRQRVAGIAGD
jgi:matrixin